MRRLFFDNPYVLLLATAFLWAANGIAGKLAVGEVSPMILTGLRWVMVCACLAGLFGRRLWAQLPLLKPYRWRVLAMGTFGFTCFNALFYLAAYYTTGVNMTLLQGIIPGIVIVGAAIFFGLKVRAFQVVGVVLTIIGVVVVSTHGDLQRIASLEFNIGDLFILIASTLYAGYTLALRNRPDIPGIVFFTGLAVAALVTSIPLIAIEELYGNAMWPTLKGWAILIFIALGPSLLSQLMFMRGVTLIGPSRAGIFVNMVPIFGAILAVAILGEPFGLYHAVALALVIGGIFIAERR